MFSFQKILEYIRPVLISVLVISFSIGLYSTSVIQAQTVSRTSDGEIKSVNVMATLHEDGVVHVSEELTYDLGESAVPGFTRSIPTTLRGFDDTDMSFVVDVQEVVRDNLPEQFVVDRNPGQLLIHTGQASILLSGEHEYRFLYTMSGSLVSGDDSLNMVLPFTFDGPVEDARVALQIQGSAGFTLVECEIRNGQSIRACPVEDAQVRGERTFIADAGTLGSEDNLYLIAQLPPGAADTTEVSDEVVVIGDISVNQTEAGVGLGILTLLALLLWWLHSRKKHRKSGSKLGPRGAPPRDVRPIHVGMFVDDKLHTSDLVAALLWMARSGRIKISSMSVQDDESENTAEPAQPVDYEIMLSKDLEYIAEIPERKLLMLLFGEEVNRGSATTLSGLADISAVPSAIEDIRKSIENDLVDLGYRRQHHRISRAFFMGLGSLLLLGSVLALGLNLISPGLALMFMVLGGIALSMELTRSDWTEEGWHTRERLRSFGMFLTLTPRDRRKFPRLGDRQPNEFLYHFPFAVALDVSEQWANQFAHMYVDPPEWYPAAYSSRSISHGVAAEAHRFESIFETWFTSSQQASKTSKKSEGDEATSKELFVIHDFDEHVAHE